MTQTKKEGFAAIDKRLAVVGGHLESVRNMLKEGRDCAQIITQLLAVQRAVKSAGVAVLKNHIDVCVKGAAGDADRVLKYAEEFQTLMELFI